MPPGKMQSAAAVLVSIISLQKTYHFLTGPVWFNDTDVNGRWKWTVQLDINVPVFDKLFK